MLSVAIFYCYADCRYAECYYAECYYAECYYAECYYAECYYAECYYAECHYAECRYAECRGALVTTLSKVLGYFVNLPFCRSPKSRLCVLYPGKAY
jgi:hypothetical protein